MAGEDDDVVFGGGRRSGKSFLQRLREVSHGRAPRPDEDEIEKHFLEIREMILEAERIGNYGLASSLQREFQSIIRQRDEMRRRRMMEPWEIEREEDRQRMMMGGMWGDDFVESRPEKVKTKDFKDLPKVALPKHLLQGAVKLNKDEIDKVVSDHVAKIRGKK